ncbi:ribonuclease H-like domain-containing protein [Tanacetum coccineum]
MFISLYLVADDRGGCECGGGYEDKSVWQLTVSRWYKARLVANDRSQQFGVECDETFSLVFKQVTIRTVLSLALSRDWPIRQLDIKNAFLNGYALRVGFSSSRCDSSLFIYRHGAEVAYLLIYVDDIILTTSSIALLHCIIASLHIEFKMIDLGHLNLQQVCLYMHNPREPHFAALKRVFRYVCGTLNFRLQLYASTTGSLVAYSDVDWVGCPTNMRSTSGYCVFLGVNLLLWSSKQQNTLSRSSVEAEYRGVANAVAKTAWHHDLLYELHTPLLSATLVYCDNVSAIYLSANPVQYQRTKHVEIDIHFVRDMVTQGQVRCSLVPHPASQLC